MNVIVFGATGMIGQGALIECLDDPNIENVLAVVRRPTGRTHPKLRELIHQDYVTTSDQLGRALIGVAREGHPKTILEGVDINAVCD